MEMGEQNAANQLVSAFKTERMDRAVGLSSSKRNNDAGEEIENEC